MRAYLITTGAVFGLITLAHVGRMIAEGPRLLGEPVYILLTIVAGAFCGWAVHLLRRAPKP